MRFWDVRSKTCVSRLDVGGEAFTLSWSADGSVLMVGRKVRKAVFAPVFDAIRERINTRANI